MHRSIASFALLAPLILLLTGCAGGATYASPSELQKAYVATGAECPEPLEVPELMVSEGAHAILCPNVTMLIVFDSDEAKNRYLARTLDGSGDLQAVVGERWVVMSSDAKDLAPKLGGELKTG